MRVPRRGRESSEKPSPGPSEAQREAVQAARAEADAVARRERAQRRELQSEDWQIRLRGGALEAKRRLAPVGRNLRAFLGRIAPPISSALLALLRLPVVGVAKVLDGATGAVGWARPRLGSLASAFAALVVRRVTPVNAVAFVALVAAVSLGVSQVLDYRGVAVGGELYEGEVGTVAPAPLTDVEKAGAAHLYLLLPIAVAAIVLTVAAAMGRWGLGRVLAGLGLLTVLVTLAIDLPTGLNAGNSGDAYASSDVELLEGFWIQLFTGTVIALCGFLLARYVKAEHESPASHAESGTGWRPPGLSSRKRERSGEPSGNPPAWRAGA